MDNILEESMRWFALFEDVLISICKFISVCSCTPTSVYTIRRYDVVNNFCQSLCFSSQAEESSEPSSQAQNGEKTPAINEENIAKAAASALAAAAVKAKVHETEERS